MTTGSKEYQDALQAHIRVALEKHPQIAALFRKHQTELAHRDHEANKGTFGRLTLVAGSRGMAGAAFLSGRAAFACGQGLVKYLGPEYNRVILQTLLPEAMYDCFEAEEGMSPEAFAERLKWGDYLIVGPGLSKDGRARRMVRAFGTPEVRDALKDKKLIVFDADALNIMAEECLDPGAVRPAEEKADGGADAGRTILEPPVVITPHVAEMARLTGLSIGEIKADPAEVAASYADAHGVLVVLKDARTAVAAPGRAAAMIDSGCGAMAKAGSGDVLCGFISGYTAMLHGCVEDAVPLAVFMHGIAGCAAAEKTGEHSLLARDIAEAAGEVLARVLSEI